MSLSTKDILAELDPWSEDPFPRERLVKILEELLKRSNETERDRTRRLRWEAMTTEEQELAVSAGSTRTVQR